MQSSKFKVLSFGYLLVLVGLFFYSFTQVDLSLTLSQWSIWQEIQKFFQNIGYFQRPVSSLFYIVLILLLFLFYLLFLRLAGKNRLKKSHAWFLVLAATIILTFSYNAFSYDVFNYIFDAKIVTYYHQDPYTHKALDYLGDPMLSFMHWTHRTYPYGPTWLFLTVPLFFLGFDFFLLTFFLFKILTSLSFVGTVFFVGKILQKISPKDEVFGLVFLGLNPLVLIEGIVSGHNDITMMVLFLGAIYAIMNRQNVRSFLLFLLSVGVKFATVFAAPVLGVVYFLILNKKNVQWKLVFLLLSICMTVGVILASLRTNFQPWYLLNILPVAALIAKNRFILIPSLFLSFFSLLQYLPFLYTGNWDPPIPSILFWMTTSSIFISGIVVVIWFLRQRGIK